MELTVNRSKELVYNDELSEDNAIHLVHCSDNLSDIKDDVATPYLVAEECTNFPRIHLVTDFSEDEALQQVGTYLREKENVEDTHLIGVFELTIKQ